MAVAVANDEHLGRLRSLVQSSDWRLRSGAAEAVGRKNTGTTNARDYATVVAALLRDPQSETRRSAADALRRLGGGAAPAVADLLCTVGLSAVEDGDKLLLDLVGGDVHRFEALMYEARARTAATDDAGRRTSDLSMPESLAYTPSDTLRLSSANTERVDLGASGAFSLLSAEFDYTVRTLPMVDSEPEMPVQTGSADVLNLEAPMCGSGLGEVAAHDALMVLMTHSDTTVQAATLAAIGAAAPPTLLQHSKTAPPSLPNSLPPTLPNTGRSTGATLVDTRTLPRPPVAAENDIVRLLTSRDAHERLAAVKALQQRQDLERWRETDTLLSLLMDPDPRVGSAAADALGPAMASKVDAIIPALSSQFAVVREACARALGRIGVGHVAPNLASLLADEDLVVRRAATYALAALGPSGTDAAVDMLRHPDAEVRQSAVLACVSMVDPSESESASECACKDPEQIVRDAENLQLQLEALLDDESPEARRAAARILERVDAILSRQFDDGNTRSPRMSSRDPSSVESRVRRNVTLLEDLDPDERLAALRRLVEIWRKDTFDPSSEPAKSMYIGIAKRLEDEVQSIRQAAAEAFGEFQEAGADAVQVLASLLRHPLQSVRRAACASLGSLGVAGQLHAADRHVALFADESPIMRCNAIEALLELLPSGVTSSHVQSAVRLSTDPHWRVRATVAEFMFRCEASVTEPYASVMRVLAHDADWRVRRAVST